MSQLLSVANLCKSFADEPVVKSVSFDVEESTTLGIVGESGSGKTTLVRSILRAIDPDSGSTLLPTGADSGNRLSDGGVLIG